MTASESETGVGSARGKSLAWRSRSSKDMGGSRDGAGSESGRDIGRNIANWWTSAVEQTSTFLMDEVSAGILGCLWPCTVAPVSCDIISLSDGARRKNCISLRFVLVCAISRV